MKNKQLMIALIIFIIISSIFLLPIFQNIGDWGIHDYDQHFMYHGVPKETILQFNQFPLWNPYYCGGNVMLANPQSTFLNPLFIFILIFGEVVGIKILILIYLILGLFGMFLLARHLKISLISSYLTAILFMLSGFFAMRLSIGQTVYLQLALIPFVVLFYLKSLDKIKFIFLSSLFMVFIFFGGGIYPLFFIVLFLTFYSVFLVIKTLKIKYLKNLFLILILFLLFSSVKLIPMLEFTNEHSFVKKDFQDNNFNKMIEALTLRDSESRLGYMYDFDINGYNVIWGWHEYHSYIGFLPIILLLISFIFLFKKEWPLILIIILFFIIALGKNSIINIWGILRNLPLISDVHGASRFLSIFIFSSALLIGKFTSIFENKRIFLKFKNKKFNVWKIILILLILIIFIDLFLVNSPLFIHTFVREPLEIEKQDFFQVTGDREKAQYPVFLANLGIVNCFDRVKTKLIAIPRFDTKTGAYYKNYIGEAYILENNNTQEILFFSPNKIIVLTKEKGSLVLNQNYVKGWKSKNNEVKNVNGLVGIDAEKGQVIEFYYLPNSFILGLIITFISLIIGFILFFKFK